MRIKNIVRGRNSASDPPEYSEERIPKRTAKDDSFTYNGNQYYCHVFESPDRGRRVAYGRAGDREGSRLFSISDGDLEWSRIVNRPNSAAVANDGTVAVAEQGAHDTLSGDISVIGTGGEEQFGQRFDRNILNCVISEDGQYVAVITHPPEGKISFFDVMRGERTATYEVDDEDVDLLGFVRDSSNFLLYVSRSGRTDPYFALDMEGSITWRSERYRDTQSLLSRIRNWKRS